MALARSVAKSGYLQTPLMVAWGIHRVPADRSTGKMTAVLLWNGAVLLIRVETPK